MKVFVCAIMLCYSFSLSGKCPAMRKSASKEKNVVSIDTNETIPKKASPEKIYNIYDPERYKFLVNGNKFQNLSTARKYMMILQDEAKKKGLKLEVIKVNTCTYNVVSEEEAKKQFSLLKKCKNKCKI